MSTGRTLLAVLLVAALGFAVLVPFLPGPALEWLGRENAGVEAASAALHILWSVTLAWSLRPWRRFHRSVIGLLLADREFDPDMVSAGSPLATFLLQLEESALPSPGREVVLLLALGWLAVSLLRFDLLPFLRGLRAGDAPAWAVAAGGVTAVAGQLLDQLPKHVEVASDALLLQAFEEYTETIFAVCLVFATICLLLRERRTARRAR